MGPQCCGSHSNVEWVVIRVAADGQRMRRHFASEPNHIVPVLDLVGRRLEVVPNLEHRDCLAAAAAAAAAVVVVEAEAEARFLENRKIRHSVEERSPSERWTIVPQRQFQLHFLAASGILRHFREAVFEKPVSFGP